MNKILQTNTDPFNGNCFAACVAMTFDIPIEEAFDCQKLSEEDKKRWVEKFIEWANKREKTVVYTTEKDFDYNLKWFKGRAILAYHKNIEDLKLEKSIIAHAIAADYGTNEIYNPLDSIRFWTLNYTFKYALLII